jgi:fatty-acyl-CoA synthase
MHLGARATEHPDRPAVIMTGSGEVTTYRQLDERSTRLARAFRRAGLRAGDHVALMMQNSSAFLETAWAAQRSGLYYTALNSHLRRDEAQYILDDCGASALVISAGLADVAGTLDLGAVPLRIVTGGPADGFTPYREVLDAESATRLEDEAEGREMLYSSGTTGVPKGVAKPLGVTVPGHPESAAVAIATGIGAMGVDGDSVYLSPAPLYHSAPLVYSMSMHRLGATALVMESFDASACLAAIGRYRVTHAQFVPTMFTRLLRLPDGEREAADVSSLRYVVHAAAPCPVDVKRRMLEWWGPIIYEYYAGTEDIGSSFIGPAEWLTHPGSVGRPRDEMHIVGVDGNDVPTGETGTVYFSGGRAFEYHNDPDKTASIQDRHGWRTLGDVGHVDEDGYLYLTDRSADMVVSGGVNIYPREAEQLLAGHPAVLDVAVFGVPDEEMGEAVKAVVQFADPSSPVAEDELLAWCRQRLAAYKCPRSIDPVDEMPRDPNGKLFKRLLRDPYWEGHGSRIV